MFASNGEKLERLRCLPSRPDGVRILGMGDDADLSSSRRRTFDQAEAEQLAAKLGTGNEFHTGRLSRAAAGDSSDGAYLESARMLPGMGR